MPTELPARGREEIETIARRVFKAVEVIDLGIVSDEVVIMGDWAFSRGSYEALLRVGAQDIHRQGNVLAVLRRQTDGSRRIFREMVIPVDEILP